jgi:hypothetical protein
MASPIVAPVSKSNLPLGILERPKKKTSIGTDQPSRASAFRGDGAISDCEKVLAVSLRTAKFPRMELPGVPRDTSAAAERRVIEGLRRMTPESRLEQTRALCRAVNDLAIAGIRLREGDLSESELSIRLGRLRYDAELVTRVQAYRSKQCR